MTAAPEVRARLETERSFAIRAVAAAGRLTRAVRDELDPPAAASKEDRSPVTVADLGAQALVRMALAEAFPDDGLMGEEDSAPLAGSAGLAGAVLERVRALRAGTTLNEVGVALEDCDDPGGPGRRWWTLDPVDGTKGFLRNGQYAVALALVEDGEVVVAAMACPNLPLRDDRGGPIGGWAVADGPDASGAVGCLFVAAQGQGAWELPLADSTAALPGSVKALPGRPLRAAAPESPAQARYAESVEAAHSDQSESALIGRLLGLSDEPLRMDSQAKYAVVARGEASIYLRLPHGDYQENVWDHAAGSLIVSEAGGRVTDAAGLPLDFTTGTKLTRNRGIVASAGGPIHDAVLEAVRSVLG